MPSINVDIGYPGNRKTMRLCAVLGPDADAIPIRLWLYAAVQCPATGHLYDHSDSEIETICRWRGEAGSCLSALLDVGFLKRTKRGVKINDWVAHEGHLVSYTERAKKAAKSRWDKGKQIMLQASTKDASFDATQPNPTQPNPTPNTQPNPAKQPASIGQGGSFASGEGKGRAGSGQGDIADATAKLEVQSLLASVHVNHAVQTQLLGRRDVTPAKVRGLIEKIRQDPAVSDIGAVLVHRLNGRGKA